MKRGRPRKFRGTKDRAGFAKALKQQLPAVIDFIVAWRLAQLLPVEAGRDRRNEALEAVALEHGLSTRTLERRYAELRFIAEPMAEMELNGQGGRIPLTVEQSPVD